MALKAQVRLRTKFPMAPITPQIKRDAVNAEVVANHRLHKAKSPPSNIVVNKLTIKLRILVLIKATLGKLLSVVFSLELGCETVCVGTDHSTEGLKDEWQFSAGTLGWPVIPDPT